MYRMKNDSFAGYEKLRCFRFAFGGSGAILFLPVNQPTAFFDYFRAEKQPGPIKIRAVFISSRNDRIFDRLRFFDF